MQPRRQYPMETAIQKILLHSPCDSKVVTAITQQLQHFVDDEVAFRRALAVVTYELLIPSIQRAMILSSVDHTLPYFELHRMAPRGPPISVDVMPTPIKHQLMRWARFPLIRYLQTLPEIKLNSQCELVWKEQYRIDHLYLGCFPSDCRNLSLSPSLQQLLWMDLRLAGVAAATAHKLSITPSNAVIPVNLQVGQILLLYQSASRPRFGSSYPIVGQCIQYLNLCSVSSQGLDDEYSVNNVWPLYMLSCCFLPIK